MFRFQDAAMALLYALMYGVCGNALEYVRWAEIVRDVNPFEHDMLRITGSFLWLFQVLFAVGAFLRFVGFPWFLPRCSMVFYRNDLDRDDPHR